MKDSEVYLRAAELACNRHGLGGASYCQLAGGDFAYFYDDLVDYLEAWIWSFENDEQFVLGLLFMAAIAKSEGR